MTVIMIEWLTEWMNAWTIEWQQDSKQVRKNELSKLQSNQATE